MKNRILFRLGMAVAAFLSFAGMAYAVYGNKELELSTPIGGDVLPGGDLSAGNIESGIIFSKIIPFAIRYGIGLAIAAAVIALIIGGYQFMTAYGNTEKHDAARTIITYALIGLSVAITAYGIVIVVSSFSFT